MIHYFSNNRILLNTISIVHQSIRSKLKRFIQRSIGEPFKIIDQQYFCDEWTNVPDKVIQLIERPDLLYKTEGNPIFLVAQSLREHFSQFRCFEFRDPVVNLWQNFDSILVPKDHVSRSRADTFYIDRQYVLRSHTSAHQSQCFRKLAHDGDPNKKFMILGDVYRRDEVNRTHHVAFHQAEIVQLYSLSDLQMLNAGIKTLFDESNQNRTDKCQERHHLKAVELVEQQLKSQVESYIHRMFDQEGNDPIKIRWIPAYFPFTHPSWELEIRLSHEDDDEWLEMLGCGIIEQNILDRDGHCNQIGWALGFGLERLAMLFYSIPDIRLFWTRDTGFLSQFSKLKPFERYRYKPISSYPQKIFDISFWLPFDSSPEECWSANDVHSIIFEIGADLVEQVYLIDQWKRPSDGRESNCYRIVYRSHERALTNEEVNKIHQRIEKALVDQLNVSIR